MVPSNMDQCKLKQPTKTCYFLGCAMSTSLRRQKQRVKNGCCEMTSRKGEKSKNKVSLRIFASVRILPDARGPERRVRDMSGTKFEASTHLGGYRGQISRALPQRGGKSRELKESPASAVQDPSQLRCAAAPGLDFGRFRLGVCWSCAQCFINPVLQPAQQHGDSYRAPAERVLLEDALKRGWLAMQTELVLRRFLRTMQNIRRQVLSFEAACHETRDDTSPHNRFSLECWSTQAAEGRDALCLFRYLPNRNCSEALESLA